MSQDVFTIAGLTATDPFTLQDSIQTPDFFLKVTGNTELERLGGFYVADPFIFALDGKEYLFFELLRTDGKGVICCAERAPSEQQWKNYRLALEEPFHLSYPLIFNIDGWLYMTVESADADEVRLYRTSKGAIDQWQFHKTLFVGKYYDPTPFKYHGTWFMFTCTELDFSVTNLFVSELGLEGPWQSHPSSPVIQNDSGAARPAGPVLQWHGTYYRLAQDCSQRYGAAVRAFKIVELTKTKYEEQDAGILLKEAGLDTERWNSHGMHQLQVYRRTEDQIRVIVDGYTRI